MTKEAYFSLSTQIKQILFASVCDTTAGIGSEPPPPYGQTDVKVEIAM